MNDARTGREIAIIGIGCRFGGGADDVQRYWEMTVDGRDGFETIPPDRWDITSLHDANPRQADKTYADRGAFIRDIRSFPAVHLQVPPRRVEVMDPQQRLLLECSLQAIEDAGLIADEVPKRTGVYAGITASEFRTVLSGRTFMQSAVAGDFGEKPKDPSALTDAVNRIVKARPFTAPGSLGNMAAATVAQELGLTGPAFTVDAACSSAMVALHSAVSALRAGEIDTAIAGGAYVNLTPDHYIAFSRIGAMSKQGACLPFDERADGFVQGDGAGMILMKRLEDAERDGDRVYAVLRGIALNNDGGGEGPMAPVESGQIDCIELAWDDAELDAANLGYIEAHGTGTSVGDLVEFRGLASTVGNTATDAVIGSAKANIGHTMSAAGIAGVIRAVLAIYHRVRPPMANFESPKPDLEIDKSPFRIQTEADSWDAEQRVACVSAFGFGGTNGHCVLAAHPQEAVASDAPELVLLSAPTEAALRDLCGRTARAVDLDANATVAGVARAWNRREAHEARLAVVASTRSDLIEKLTEFGAGGQSLGTAFGTVKGEAPKVAFLFPGQGAQRVGMLADLRDRFPLVEETLAAADAAVEGITGLPISHYLYPERRAEAVSAEVADAELTATANCQPALIAVGSALVRLLGEAGVAPAVVAGHSVGEFTAAHAGGVLSLEDAVRWAAARGRAMTEGPIPENGAMAAIVADRETVEGLLVEGAVVANVNHPNQTVVSGLSAAVDTVAAAAGRAGLKAVRLNVSHGFHSPIFDRLEFDPIIDSLTINDPSIPVASCIQDHPYADAAEARGVFGSHAVSPVIFTSTLRQCVEAGADVFLQVGAGGPVLSFAKGALKDVPHRGILSAASKDDADGGASFLQCLGELWVRGVPVDAAKVTSIAPVASVPPTVMEREDYWPIKVESTGSIRVQASTRPAPIEAETVAETSAPLPADTGVASIVIAAVASASAYPQGALKPEMRLGEDLGFDSMMVADLAEELTKQIEGVRGIPQAILVNSPTIADLIAYAENPAAYAGDEDIDDDAPLARFEPVWRRSSALAPGPGLSGVRVAFVGPALLALGDALIQAGALLVEPADADLIVWSTCGMTLPTVSAILADEAETPDLADEFFATVSKLSNAPTIFALRDTSNPWAESVAGAVRALARDWPNANSKNIWLDEASADAAVAAIVAEFGSSDTTVDVRYGGSGRAIRGMRRIPEQADAWRPTERDMICVSGGTRGIGLSLSRRLAESGARVVLVGRSAPDAEAQAFIDESEGRVTHVAVDVTDRAAVKAAFASHPPITAFVHSAGLLADGALDEVDEATGRRARAVKVKGFLNTLVAVNGSLKVALGIGSWSGRFGSRHQAHYAAGNAMLAELSRNLPGRLRGVCSEFGPWTESDMASSIPEAVMQAMRADGVDFVGQGAGLDALVEDLGGSNGIIVRGRRVPATLRSTSRRWVVSTDSHPYLSDHTIDGHPILPLAVAAQLMAETADARAPFEIDGLRLWKGVVADSALALDTEVLRENVSIKIGSTLHYDCRVRPLAADTSVPEALEDGDAPLLSVADYYQNVTFHGPMFEGVSAVARTTPDAARGTVLTSDPSTWMPGENLGTWRLDPLAFDAAMQLCAFVGGGGAAAIGTPVGFDRYVQLRPPLEPGSTLDAQVSLRASDDVAQNAFDIVLRDEMGVAVALVENLVVQLRDAPAAAVEADVDWGDFEVKEEWVNPAEWQGYKDLELRFQMVEAMGLQNPYFDLHEGTARDTSVIDGREVINFSSYNYLGLSGDERVRRDVTEAMAQYGTSVSASRIASGERPFHRDLERLLADSLGVEDAIIFPSGHATNVTVIGHLFGPNDLILHDELIHDSCLQGIKLSGAARRSFRHEDIDHAEQQLRELRPHYEKVLLLTEGVYSMDGDISNTPEFIRLKQSYGCMLMIDEAHSFGTIGPLGFGIKDHFGLQGPEVDLWMGTMSKSLASTGGWIGGSKALVTYLRYTTPGFVFAAGMTPTLGQAALSSLRLIHEETWRVEKVQHNSRFFCDQLTSRGLDVGVAKGESPVVPVVTGDSMHALLLAQALLDKGINAKPIIFPAVADDAARLRFFLSTCHTEEQLEFTAETIRVELERIRKG